MAKVRWSNGYGELEGIISVIKEKENIGINTLVWREGVLNDSWEPILGDWHGR